jgi:succinate dehydrogenase assembly factor 1
MKYSGIQRQVLSLYRQCLRASRKKDPVSGAIITSLCLHVTHCITGFEASFRSLCEVSRHSIRRGLTRTYQQWADNFGGFRKEFEKGVALDKKDFGTIEYLLRKGERQLEMYSAPGIKDIR